MFIIYIYNKLFYNTHKDTEPEIIQSIDSMIQNSVDKCETYILVGISVISYEYMYSYET
jgi:hypothetical protein